MKREYNLKIKHMLSIVTMLITMFSTFALATSSIDVTPPRGKIEVKNIIQSNDLNFVKSTEVAVEVIAEDDYEGVIQFYLSSTPISKAEEIPEKNWIRYSRKKITSITLPNADGNNTIYLALRDEAGNTSLIYNNENVQYTIEYNANATEAILFESTVNTKAYYGMPFKVTSRIPTREGYYFLGWSTDADATTPSYRRSSIIPANVFLGGSKTVTLYAVWAENSNGDVEISELVDVGDYVEFPVSYDNVNRSTYTGWRVISKDVDLDGNSAPGRVNIISAGTPLTYYHGEDADFSVTALTDNFLVTDFSDSENYTYRKNGFLPNKTLTQIFTNKYVATKEDGVTPDVRAMVAEDIYRISDFNSMAINHTMDLENLKYENLLVNKSDYWLATKENETNLWKIEADGNVEGYNSNEYGIRPVVSLKGETIIKGTTSNGEWIVDHPGYTVTYVVIEGELGEVQNNEKKTFGVDYSITAKEPKREGFKFLGWSTNESATEPEYLKNDIYTLNSDITLYSVWEKNNTVVTYDANGGNFDLGTTNEMEYKYALGIGTVTQISKTSNVSEDGSTYSGGYGNYQSEVDVVTIPGATELEVTITYETESTSCDWVCLFDSSIADPTNASYSESVPKEKLGGRKTTNTYIIPGDTVQIYFRSDGSSDNYYGYYAVIKGQGETSVLTLVSGEYKNPTREGFNLLGWSSDKNATEPEYDIEEIKEIKDDMGFTVYAVWRADDIIIYDANGGSFDSGTTNEVRYNYEKGIGTITKISKTENVNEDGSTNSNSYGNNQSKLDVITIAGSPELEVTITYETNDSYYDWIGIFDGSVDDPAEASYWDSIPEEKLGGDKDTRTYIVPGDTVQIYFKTNDYSCSGYGYYAVVKGVGETFVKTVASGEYKEPTKEYYNIVGWSTNKDATEPEYNLGVENVPDLNNVTLYAIWKLKEDTIANAPILGTDEEGNLLMEAVYWSDENASEELTATAFTEDMYSYEKGIKDIDSKKSKWANAKTIEDGSYWVWIPRFAYKITYYSDEDRTQETTSKKIYGKVDIIFLKGTSNTEYMNLFGETKTLPEGYTVHPAFQAMTETEITEGLNSLRKMGYRVRRNMGCKI